MLNLDESCKKLLGVCLLEVPKFPSLGQGEAARNTAEALQETTHNKLGKCVEKSSEVIEVQKDKAVEYAEKCNIEAQKIGEATEAQRAGGPGEQGGSL